MRRPSRPEIVIALVSGVALPAAALAPFPRLIYEYRALYAAQDMRFRDLCKSAKMEIFGVASGPASVFFDPNEHLSCWDVRDDQCQALKKYHSLAQYLVINREIEFVEFWEDAVRGKPRKLKRCYGRDKCGTLATVNAVTAKYRVTTRESQSTADRILRLRVRTVTVDERETEKVLGRLQFVYSNETHRICAPGAKEGDDFDSGYIVDITLKLVARY